MTKDYTSFFEEPPSRAIRAVQRAYNRAMERNTSGFVYSGKFIRRELGFDLARVGIPDVPFRYFYRWISCARYPKKGGAL